MTSKKKSDGADEQRPPESQETPSQRDGEQDARFDLLLTLAEASAKTAEQINTLIESQGASYAAAIRLALLASSFGSFAWMLTLLLIIFGNPIGALWVAVAFFGVLSVVFFWLAFNARFINWLKNKFERRKRR